jgi:hypothetical protein
MALRNRIRGQARSYNGFGSAPNFASAATSVGAGLLANAVYQAMAMARTDRGVSGDYNGAHSTHSRASALLQ